MKAASSVPVDRSGLYTQLHHLLQPGQGSVIDLLPADSRPIWEALAAVANYTAAQQQRSGAPTEAQQERALQQLEQLLEAAENGQKVYLTADGCPSVTNSGNLLLNRILPQILAHRSTAEDRDYQGKFLFTPLLALLIPWNVVQLESHCKKHSSHRQSTPSVCPVCTCASLSQRRISLFLTRHFLVQTGIVAQIKNRFVSTL